MSDPTTSSPENSDTEMPPKGANKRKKTEEDEESGSSSDSSGPVDRNPVGGKKPSAGASAAAKKEADEPTWELDRRRYLKVREFKGKTFIDIREFYEKDGKELPGKKGISLTTTQWAKLKGIIAEVDKAVEGN